MGNGFALLIFVDRAKDFSTTHTDRKGNTTQFSQETEDIRDNWVWFFISSKLYNVWILFK